jgi:hypothetical protein
MCRSERVDGRARLRDIEWLLVDNIDEVRELSESITMEGGQGNMHRSSPSAFWAIQSGLVEPYPTHARRQ